MSLYILKSTAKERVDEAIRVRVRLRFRFRVRVRVRVELTA